MVDNWFNCRLMMYDVMIYDDGCNCFLHIIEYGNVQPLICISGDGYELLDQVEYQVAMSSVRHEKWL